MLISVDYSSGTDVWLSMVVFKEDEDLPYEEDILRNPYSVKSWLRYIEHKKGASKLVVNLVYERALRELPGRLVFKSHIQNNSVNRKLRQSFRKCRGKSFLNNWLMNL